MNIPNLLTLLRIALIPVFVVVFFLNFSWSNIACAGIFSFAAITDWLDGYLARRLQQHTKLGAFLDPVADKLMVAAALVLLVQRYPTVWMAVPALIIISREISISALREWMAVLGERASVAVSYIGKVKTFVQMVAIAGLLANITDYANVLVILSYLLLYVSAILTVWSMVMYLRAAWPVLQRSDGE